ncbi:MAG: DinB family protein [Bryobacterales bacterium]|nr:DinB family protein [Bryobacterales bacterium]
MAAAPVLTLNPALAAIEEELEQVKREVAGIVSGMSEAEFRWQPAPDRWSISQHLGHLTLSAIEGFPRFDRAIADARRRKLYGAGPFRYGLLTGMALWFIEPPPKRFVKTSAQYTAPTDTPMMQVIEEFSDAQEGLLDRLYQCQGLDLARAKVESPMPGFRIELGAGFALLAAHERRHLWHVRRMLPELRSAVNRAG